MQKLILRNSQIVEPPSFLRHTDARNHQTIPGGDFHNQLTNFEKHIGGTKPQFQGKIISLIHQAITGTLPVNPSVPYIISPAIFSIKIRIYTPLIWPAIKKPCFPGVAPLFFFRWSLVAISCLMDPKNQWREAFKLANSHLRVVNR